jgi:tripartite-type tricarboxylate transporter receptor subunit TctC
MAKRLLFLVSVILFATAVHAQPYPAKPVRMVVGFPPGGGTDVVARIITPRYSELLGQAVVIENRPGATGTMAAGQVAKSAPDGYTIMMGHVSVNAIAPALFANLPYDMIRDFAPVGIAAAVPHFVTVHPSLQVNSLQQLISFMKTKPEPLTFPSAGNGSDVPTAEEAGLAGYQVITWYGVFAPAGTPAPIVNRLHADLVKAMQTPDVRSKLEGIGADGTVSRSPEEFAALVRSDTARYAKIVKDIGLRIE